MSWRAGGPAGIIGARKTCDMTELFHPRDPGVIENPYPMYHRLQDEDPVHRSDAFSTWATLACRL